MNLYVGTSGYSYKEWKDKARGRIALWGGGRNIYELPGGGGQAEFATASCRVEIGGRRVCSAELLFSFLPLENLAPAYRDEVLESYLASLEQEKA